MISYKYEIGQAVWYKGIQAYIIATLVCDDDLYYYIVFDNFQATFRDFNSYQFSERTLHYMLNSISYKDDDDDDDEY